MFCLVCLLSALPTLRRNAALVAERAHVAEDRVLDDASRLEAFERRVLEDEATDFFGSLELRPIHDMLIAPPERSPDIVPSTTPGGTARRTAAERVTTAAPRGSTDLEGRVAVNQLALSEEDHADDADVLRLVELRSVAVLAVAEAEARHLFVVEPETRDVVRIDPAGRGQDVATALGRRALAGHDVEPVDGDDGQKPLVPVQVARDGRHQDADLVVGVGGRRDVRLAVLRVLRQAGAVRHDAEPEVLCVVHLQSSCVQV